MMMLLLSLLAVPSLAADFSSANTSWTVTGFDGTTTSSTASLIWTTRGEATVATVLVGLSANDLSLKMVKVTNPAEVHQVTVPGLAPSKRYYFEVVATDADGVSVYSNVISKATKTR